MVKKRARVSRVMVMRVVGDKEGGGPHRRAAGRPLGFR
jgi:hypothetical protein